MIRAVVFDFDGVIANSEPLHFRAFRDVLRAEGVELSERDYYSRYLGYDDVGAFNAIAADRSLTWEGGLVKALVVRKAARMEELEHGESVLFPGAREAIERLAAHAPLAIASGAIRAEIVRLLEHEHLARHFRLIVAAEDTPLSKPAPDPYALAVRRLSTAVGVPLTPNECVAIEDSLWGLESARTAGLRTIGITHTYDANHLSLADLVVAHLDSLTWELIARELK
jgi:HAD superfamily hydrolase (TIGR01509 family)